MWSVALGKVDADALKDWWYEVLADKDLKEGYLAFCDATQLTSLEYTSADLSAFRTLIDMAPQRMHSKLAVLVQEGDMWRVTEGIRALGDALGVPMKLFEDRAAACAWLGLAPDIAARITASQ
jgi:hypothetical protein